MVRNFFRGAEEEFHAVVFPEGWVIVFVVAFAVRCVVDTCRQENSPVIVIDPYFGVARRILFTEFLLAGRDGAQTAFMGKHIAQRFCRIDGFMRPAFELCVRFVAVRHLKRVDDHILCLHIARICVAGYFQLRSSRRGPSGVCVSCQFQNGAPADQVVPADRKICRIGIGACVIDGNLFHHIPAESVIFLFQRHKPAVVGNSFVSHFIFQGGNDTVIGGNADGVGFSPGVRPLVMAA